MKPVLVADFNPVIPALRQLGEEAVEISDEVPTVLVVGGVEPAELEHQQTDVVPERLTRFQERVNEQFGVEEVLVWLSRLHSETGQVGEPFQRDVVGHFEGEEEIARHLFDQSAQVFGGRKLVIGGIYADRFEDLRVFGEAVPFKPGLGKLPSVAVALFVVNLPTPA